MLNLKVILASTRPGRKGPAIANWFYDLAAKHPAFNTELIDLAVINLPFLDEPNHPRFKKYTQKHTKDWSAMIDPADAFVVVMSEYNYGFPATIKNALDFLAQEWQYKPMAFVSYGGVSGGTRGVQMLKGVVTALDMMPLSNGVHLPAFGKRIDEHGQFNSDEGLDKAANGMLDDLNKWGIALKTMRAEKA